MELKQENPEIWQKLVESRKHLERRLEKQNPEVAKGYMNWKKISGIS